MGKKRKFEKESKNEMSIMNFFYTIYLAILRIRCIQNLKTMALIGAEKYATEMFDGEKEKWTNETDKQYLADSLLHSTT